MALLSKFSIDLLEIAKKRIPNPSYYLPSVEVIQHEVQEIKKELAKLESEGHKQFDDEYERKMRIRDIKDELVCLQNELDYRPGSDELIVQEYLDSIPVIYSDSWDPSNIEREAAYQRGRADAIKTLTVDNLYGSESHNERENIKNKTEEYFAINGEITQQHQIDIDYWRGFCHVDAFVEDAWRAAAERCEFTEEMDDKQKAVFEYFETTILSATKKSLKKETTVQKVDYRIPGFISDVMDLTTSTAAYPNERLAFCGALSLFSSLVSRKIQFQGLAPNLYVMGLANSGGGKDQPRKVNAKILAYAGLGAMLGNSFASGEGIEDAMFITNSKLFQTDEFDVILAAIACEKEGRYQTVAKMLLELFTSANSIYCLRPKAGEDGVRVIHNPALCMFATCIPTSFYGSLSAKLLSNGLVSRMLIVEAGTRGRGQRPKPIQVTETIKRQVEHWRDMVVGDGNLAAINSEPKEMDIEEAASIVLDAFRNRCDDKYANCEKSQDNVGMAIWSRGYELACKLSMIHAASAKPFSFCIGIESSQWATKFVEAQIESLLLSVVENFHESEFDRLCRKALKRIESFRSDPSRAGISQSDLLRYMHISTKELGSIIDTLENRSQIQALRIPSATGRPTWFFLAI